MAKLMAVNWLYPWILAKIGVRSSSKNWSKIIFSTYALWVVKEVNSVMTMPNGCNIKKITVDIRDSLSRLNWSLVWNAKNSNKFADCLC